MRGSLLTLTLCLFVLPANAKYSGGTGEPNDPYQIATAADLIALGGTPGDYDKHFILTDDIDLDPDLPSGRVFDKAVIAPTWETPFTGVFDGNGHTISYLTVMGGENLGLFGLLTSGAAAKNLGLVDVKITGSGSFVGGLVGYSAGGAVSQSYATGTVNGTEYVGGLVGKNSGAVRRCFGTGQVNGAEDIWWILEGKDYPRLRWEAQD